MAPIEFDGLRFDPSDGTLAADGVETQSLRPLVARLLLVMLEHPGQVLDRETLCRQVWGEDRVVDFEAGLSALVKELRQALRAVGAPDTMLETVPRRGYRFHASPARAGDDAADASSPSRSRPGRSTRIALVVAATLVAVTGTWALLVPGEPVDERPRMAVVPFEVLGSADEAYGNLDLVLADTLLAALWSRELDQLVLLGRTSIGADLTGRERVQFVARELDASLVLEGSLIPGRAIDANDAGESGSGWRIEARLLRLPRGEVAWTATVSGPAGRPIAVADVARTLADDLAAHWPDLAAQP